MPLRKNRQNYIEIQIMVINRFQQILYSKNWDQIMNKLNRVSELWETSTNIFI